MQAAGNVQGALAQIDQGLETYPRETRLTQLHATLAKSAPDYQTRAEAARATAASAQPETVALPDAAPEGWAEFEQQLRRQESAVSPVPVAEPDFPTVAPDRAVESGPAMPGQAEQAPGECRRARRIWRDHDATDIAAGRSRSPGNWISACLERFAEGASTSARNAAEGPQAAGQSHRDLARRGSRGRSGHRVVRGAVAAPGSGCDSYQPVRRHHSHQQRSSRHEQPLAQVERRRLSDSGGEGRLCHPERPAGGAARNSRQSGFKSADQCRLRLRPSNCPRLCTWEAISRSANSSWTISRRWICRRASSTVNRSPGGSTRSRSRPAASGRSSISKPLTGARPSCPKLPRRRRSRPWWSRVSRLRRTSRPPTPR